jgi:glycosyltransferase involved in cell wall biosynthesis
VKIVVNAVSAKVGGAVSYITDLLRHLSSVPGRFQFLVFLPPETAAKLEGLAQDIQVLPTGVGHAGMLKRLWWDQVTLRRIVRKEKADVLFSSANFGMFRCPVRQLLLVRNALYFSKIYREMFLPKHSLKTQIAFGLRRWLIARSARNADVVMTPTQAMLDDLRRFVGVKKAVVNPYGVATPQPAEESMRGVGKPLDVARNHAMRLLYVSMYYEYKNLCTLLRALSLINKKGGAKFNLKTTTSPSWTGAGWTLTHQQDLRLARQAGIAEHLDFVGPLSREETKSLYRASDIFVFPSLSESFGFPMAEAMSHGLPIVAADTPVNREVCGDAAVYFHPLSAEDLAERLLQLATDRDLWKRLSVRGYQEARRRFCWNAHAQRILEAACYQNSEGIRDDSRS